MQRSIIIIAAAAILVFSSGRARYPDYGPREGHRNREGNRRRGRARRPDRRHRLLARHQDQGDGRPCRAGRRRRGWRRDRRRSLPADGRVGWRLSTARAGLSLERHRRLLGGRCALGRGRWLLRHGRGNPELHHRLRERRLVQRRESFERCIRCVPNHPVDSRGIRLRPIDAGGPGPMRR